MATGLVSILRSVPFLMVLAIGVVLTMYRTLPPVSPRWRSISIPAIVVGIVVVILSQVFSLLVPRLVGVAALAGSLASGFIALAWLSFTFQAILYGAAWVRARDELGRRRGRRISGAGTSRSGDRTARWRRVTDRN